MVRKWKAVFGADLYREKISMEQWSITACYSWSSIRTLCGFPEEWAVPKGLLGLFRCQKSAPSRFMGCYISCLAEEQGYHKGCWLTWTHSNAGQARHLQAISLASPGNQASSDSSPVTKQNPKAGESLCNFLMVSSPLLSDTWHTLSLLIGHAVWSVALSISWNKHPKFYFEQQFNTLNVYFSTH